MLKPPPVNVQTALAQAACNVNIAEVMANGRLELLYLLREVSISHDYHRYGNLGTREKEKRRPLPGSPEKKPCTPDEACACHV
jgi:RHH-type proline utilization regulon transcriptional repressor/proline dehydrogenase/delta 1-pyrroline-5-carboxylate dehydrogenase